MKTIYILLIKSSTMLSKIIHFVTAAPYTHVSISFDQCLQPLYSSARKNGETMFPAGPCLEWFHRGYLNRHLNIPCALYEIKVSSDVYDAAKKEAIKIVENQDDYNFNIIGLVLCHFRIPCRRKHHYFCSQFVGEVLQNSNALELSRHPSVIKPIDYTTMPGLVCKYEGTLHELVQIRANMHN